MVDANSVAETAFYHNDKLFLIKIISYCLPFIGYPRSLNALCCVNDAAKNMENE
jgi:4-carboxymuconolactone decarboxylase